MSAIVLWMTSSVFPRQIPALWQSERLTVRDATEEDLPELRKAYEECSYIEDWIGNHDESEDPMLREFLGESLPPEGKKELQRLQTILDSSSGAIIGYFAFYHGYPDSETFWIGCLAIRPAFQRQKFGKEVIASLIENVKSLGNFSRVGIGVGVGNDPAMKFWESCGFTDLIKTEDHGAYVIKWIVRTLR